MPLNSEVLNCDPVLVNSSDNSDTKVISGRRINGYRVADIHLRSEDDKLVPQHFICEF